MTDAAIGSVRSPKELDEILARQIGHLRRSLDCYERGMWEEAERLATSVYILVVDGARQTKSLLSQMGLRETLSFVSCKTKSIPYHRLPICGVEAHGDEHVYFPLFMLPTWLHHDVRRLPFAEWWNETIYLHNPGVELTREKFVCTLRSQDGGAHVDQKITREAYRLIKAMGNDALRIVDGRPVDTAMGNGGPMTKEIEEQLKKPPYRNNPPMKGAHWAAMAHIAWELDTSLSEAGLCPQRERVFPLLPVA